MAGMVTSGILFAINTTGGGKAKLAFAAVGVAVFMVGRKLLAAQKAAEEFHETFTRLSQGQRDAVREIERTTAGLIDTKAQMDGVVKMTEAANNNFKVTPKLMSSIGKIAADMAQKLGEGPEGATRRFNQLTESIAKANNRGLKPLGIEIEKEGSLLEMQQEAIRKVIERADGLTITARSLREQIYALNNNWETFLGLTAGRIGVIGVVGDLNRELGTLNDSMMSADDGFAEATMTLDSFGDMVAAATFEMVGMTETADHLVRRMGKLIEFESKLKKAKAERKAERGEFSKEYVSYTKEEWAETEAGKGGFKWFGDLKPAQQEEWKSKAGWGDVTTGEQMTFTEEEVYGKKGGGGGRAKAAPKLAGAELWQSELDAAERSKQIAFDKHVWLIENNQEYHDKIEQQQIESDAELGRLRMESEAELKEMYTVSQEDQAKWDIVTQEEKWQRQLAEKEAAQELEIQHHEWLLANSREYAQKQAEIDQAAALARVGQTKNMFTNLSSLMQVENKKAFYIGKAAAYAATVINTAEAAMASFKAMAGIPYVGPALGAVAAATAVVAGGVQLATIKKQQYGTGGGGVSAGPVGSTGGGYLGGGGNFAAGGAGAPQTTHVTVILGEEEFHGWTIDANKKASQSGKPAFAEEAA